VKIIRAWQPSLQSIRAVRKSRKRLIRLPLSLFINHSECLTSQRQIDSANPSSVVLSVRIQWEDWLRFIVPWGLGTHAPLLNHVGFTRSCSIILYIIPPLLLPCTPIDGASKTNHLTTPLSISWCVQIADLRTRTNQGKQGCYAGLTPAALYFIIHKAVCNSSCPVCLGGTYHQHLIHL